MFCSIFYKGKKSLGLRIAWFANFEPMAKTSKRRGSMKCHSPTKSMISSSSEARVQTCHDRNLQCDCRTPVHKPWTQETTVLPETCEASALNSKKIVSKEMPPNMTRQNDRTLLQRHDVPLGGKDLKDLTVLQGLAEHERQSGMSARLKIRRFAKHLGVFFPVFSVCRCVSRMTLEATGHGWLWSSSHAGQLHGHGRLEWRHGLWKSLTKGRKEVFGRVLDYWKFDQSPRVMNQRDFLCVFFWYYRLV